MDTFILQKLEEWFEYLGFDNLAEWLQIIIITASTLISEDGTMTIVTLMKQTGNLGSFVYWFGCIVGIVAGDCLIYWLGRTIAGKREKILFLNLTKFKEKAQKYRSSLFLLLMLSQAMPGARFTLYISAGMSKYPFHLFVLAKSLVAPIWVAMFYYLGKIVIEIIHNHSWIALLVAIAIVLGYWQLNKLRFKASSKSS